MPRAVLTESALAGRLAPLVRARHVPLLAIRVRELERVAWREGRQAARRLERRARDVLARVASARLRADDLLAHDLNSEIFAIALTARSRRESPLPDDCRAALGRATDAFSRALPVALESGWTLLGEVPRDLVLGNALRTALERGAGERQRYDFCSLIAHEMRTPLTAIRGYLQTLIDDPEATTARRFLEIARNESLRLSRLVDGIFAVSLLDLEYASPQRVRSATSLPGAALEGALAALGPRIQQRRAKVRTKPFPVLRVAIGYDHLVQIFANVIGNALEHGEENPHVTIAARRNASSVEITIDDDGPGIAINEREAIFNLGYRTQTSLAHGRGSGLGLAVVRRLLECAGGAVRASDSPLGGARIVIVLRAG